MEDSTRQKLRRHAARQFYVILMIVLVYSAALITLRVSFTGMGDNYSRVILGFKATQLNAEFTRYYLSRARQLIAFPPPARASEYSGWALAVQQAFDQEVAVFVRRGSEIMWLGEPEGFEAATSLAERGIAAGPARPEWIGSMETSHWTVGRNSGDAEYQVWMIGSMSEALRWGVVLRTADTWAAFCRRLDSREPAVDPDSPAWTLSPVFALPSSPMGAWQTGLRVIQGDQVLFASPDLDTTRRVHVEQIRNSPRLEFYQSRLDQFYAWEIDSPRVPWPMVLVPLLLLIPLYRMYRQLRKLTAPEPPPPVDPPLS